MQKSRFENYPEHIRLRAEKNLLQLIEIALDEDGEDLTSLGAFDNSHQSRAYIVAKEDSFAVGLFLVPMVLDKLLNKNDYKFTQEVEEGSRVFAMTRLCTIEAPTSTLLKAERVILNFMTHISGVANLSYQYVKELDGTGVTLLDTRKTLPGMRYLEKYAVTCSGARNHRLALDDMLMLKDNHIDAFGSITNSVKALRNKYEECPPIEVECRTLAEVDEAISARPDRIMLDNMSPDLLKAALVRIPKDFEVEISGNVSIENIRSLALVCEERKPDFISVGKITHSAPTADFSLKYEN